MAAESAHARVPRSIEATRVPEGEVTVDGDNGEVAWSSVNWYQQFVQRSPHEGEEPTENTRVAVLYDSDAIYVFVEAEDRQPQSIRGRLTRRDEYSPSDWVEILLAPQGDRRSGYRLALNPRGARIDARVLDGGWTEDLDWNGVWQGASRLTERGWTAEFRIPFSMLRFEDSERPWGLNVTRRLSRLHEESTLYPVPRAAVRSLQHLADLQGLSNLAQPRRIELWPHLSLAFERARGDYTLTPRAGADLQLGLGPARTLQVSLLPDFGQVQADPSQLNLTAFEVFLPEKRPFFLEGREAFRFPLAFHGRADESLFYSRRIGERPARDLGLSDDAIREYPTQSTLLGAARVVGREKSGLGYGALAAVTDGERAQVQVDGVVSHPRVAAPTAYSVGRIRQTFAHGQGALGGMVTHVARPLDAELKPYYVDQALGLASDFEWHQGNFGLVGHVAGTHLSGSPEAIRALQRSATHYFQRPDATHVDYDEQRTTMTGWSGELVGGKFDGSPWRASWRVRARSPGFDPNDLGYLQRADQQHAEIWIQRREDPPGRWHRYHHVSATAWLDKTFGPELTGQGLMLNGYWQLPDHSSTYWGVRRNWEALDTTLLRGGPGFLVPGKWDAWWGVGTDDRRVADVSFEFWGHARDHDSQLRAVASLVLDIHPSSNVKLSLAPTFDRSRDDLQYVTDDANHGTILGRLLRNTVSLTLRASWAIDHRLFLEAYAMPYLTAGTYDSFFGVASPRASKYRDRLRLTDFSGARRFALEQLRSNLVLRWEYALGSALYLVWTHEQTDRSGAYGTIRLDRGVSSMLSAQSIDVLMFKLSHYFPY